MRFTIPQFIEHEAKIVGPLTFGQFVFVAIAGATCFVLYFLVSFGVFVAACIILGGIALAFAFLKVNNRPLVVVIGNFIKFSLSPKMYLWQKGKSQKIELKEAPVQKEETPEDRLPLKIAEKSRLNNIKTQIETKSNQ